MPRLLSSLFGTILLAAAALVPGAAVFAQQTPSPGDIGCLSVTSDATTQAVQASSIIAIARVQSVEPGARAVLVPEALLKGSTSEKTLDLRYPAAPPTSGCRLATFTSGTRVFAFLAGKDGGLYWPSSEQVFVLEDGRATQQANTGWNAVNEQGLTSLVRGITGQYVVPAANPSEGAGIDWVKTVIPVTLALLIVLGIGLYLMRIWHRIDPT